MLLGKKTISCAIGCFAVLCLLAADNDLKVQHDSGIYITLGKSLATGQGYKEIFFAGEPPHTHYPPVFPLLLAPLILLLGYHFLAMKLLVITIAVFSLYLLHALYKEVAYERMASLVVIVTAASPGILFFSQSIMTEIPYLCCTLLTLLWLHRHSHDSTWPLRTVAVAVILLSLAYLTRLIGLSLLVATVLYLLHDGAGPLKLRVKRAVAIGCIAGVPALGWLLRTWWIGPQAKASYVAGYRLGGVYASQSLMEGLSSFFSRVNYNLPHYVRHSARVIFFHSPWVSETVLPLLLASLIAGGFCWCALRKRSIAEYYICIYACGLLLFPGSRPQRYLVPVIPFIWYYFLTACGRIFCWLQRSPILVEPSRQRGVVWAAKFLLVVLVMSNSVMAVLGNVVYHGKERYYHVEGEEKYRDLIPWVKAHTSPHSVFLWAKPGLRFLWSERQAINYPSMQEDEILQSIHARRIDYVVVDSFAKKTRLDVQSIVRKYSDHFRLMHENEVSKVYRVIDPVSERSSLLNIHGTPQLKP